MKEYLIKYQVENNGDTIGLISVSPYDSYIEELFYEGVPLQNICLNSSGVFELRAMHMFGDDCDYFAIISLEKKFGN